MKSFRTLLATLLCLVSLTACERVNFTAVSSPAPGATARLDDEARRIDLSAFTALAIECSNHQGPCQQVRVRVDGSDVVQVYPASVARLEAAYADGIYAGEQPVSVWIVTGLQAGETRLRFDTNAGSADLTVRVSEAL